MLILITGLALPLKTYKIPREYIGMHESEEFVLGRWVRKQLEEGDDPDVLRAALKNRGLDPDIVGHVLSSFKKNPARKKEPEEKKVSPEKFCNHALKREVDDLLASAPAENPVSEDSAVNEARVQGKTETNRIKKPQEESLFSLFLRRVFECFPHVKVKLPDLSALLFDRRIAVISGILVAIVIISLLISYGLEWYADRMARAVLQ